LECLYVEGVDTVYIGGVTDVLDTHWSIEINAKTHNFWAFKQFTERLGIRIDSPIRVDSTVTLTLRRSQDAARLACPREPSVLGTSETFLRRFM